MVVHAVVGNSQHQSSSKIDQVSPQFLLVHSEILGLQKQKGFGGDLRWTRIDPFESTQILLDF